MFNAKILIVDEHRLVAAGVQALLLMNGFNCVTTAHTINDGIDDIIHHHIDILILDPDFKEKKWHRIFTRYRQIKDVDESHTD